MEVRVQHDTRVILSLTEREAAVLNTVLLSAVDLTTSPEMAELSEALSAEEISENAVELTYAPDIGMFEVD